MARDFRNKTFQRILRGYSPEEVDEYLGYVTEEYAKLEQAAANTKRQLGMALKKLDEVSLALSIVKEQPDPSQTPDLQAEAILLEARQTAAEEAQKILAQAEQEAEQILSEAKAGAGKIYRAAGAMCDEVTSFRDTLFGLYNNHIESVEQLASLTLRCRDNLDDIMENSREEETEDEEPVRFPTPAVVEIEAEAEEEEPAEPADLPKMEEDETDDFEVPEEIPEVMPEIPEEPVYEDPQEVEEAKPEKAPAAPMTPFAAFIGGDLTIDLNDVEDDEEEADEIVGEISFSADPFGYVIGDGGDYADEEDEEDEPTPSPIRPLDASDFYEEELPEEADDDAEDKDFEPAPAPDDGDTRILDIGAILRPQQEEAPRKTPPKDDFDESFARDFQVVPDEEAFADLDALFSANLNGHNLSVTDEFDIVFANTDSRKIVEEISRQPIIPPEEPKKPKKHSKF